MIGILIFIIIISHIVSIIILISKNILYVKFTHMFILFIPIVNIIHSYKHKNIDKKC